MCEVKFTVKFSFCNGGVKPDMGEIVNFIKGLDIDTDQIVAAYRIGEEKALFLKFKTEESMLHTLTYNSEDLIFPYADGKTVEVRMSHADEFIQYVRIYDLPPEVPDKDVAAVLSKYGNVKRVVREKFPVELRFDVFTGVRGIYMDVKKEIPSALHFLNSSGECILSREQREMLCMQDGGT